MHDIVCQGLKRMTLRVRPSIHISLDSLLSRAPNYEFLKCGCGKDLVYFFLEGLFPLPFPDGFPVLLGAFRGLPLLFPPLLLPLPPFFAMLENQT